MEHEITDCFCQIHILRKDPNAVLETTLGFSLFLLKFLLNRYEIADLLIPLIADSRNVFNLVDRLKTAVLSAVGYNPLGQPITDSIKAFTQLLRRSRIDINFVAEPLGAGPGNFFPRTRRPSTAG